jgi:hypothetical protein
LEKDDRGGFGLGEGAEAKLEKPRSWLLDEMESVRD